VPATYGIAGVGPPEFAKPSCLDFMFTAPPLMPISMTLCLIGFLIGLALVDTRPPRLHPTQDYWRQVIESTAEVHLPKGSVSCGVLHLGAEAGSAVHCIAQAQRKGIAFWVLSQAPGIDSQVWTLLKGNRDDLTAVEFDSYDWETRGKPSFTSYAVRCKSYEIGRVQRRKNYDFHEGAISCVRK